MSSTAQLRAFLSQLSLQVEEQQGTLHITDEEGRSASVALGADGATISNAGRRLTLALGAQGEVLSVDRQGAGWECAYDSAGRLKALRVDPQMAIKWEYSVDGRPHKILFADGSCIRLAYDRAGTLIYVQDRNGVDHGLSAHGPDGPWRLTDGAGNITTFLPDLESPRLAVFADGSSVSYSFSDEGRLEQLLLNGRQFARYETEESGRITAVCFASGEEHRFTYQGEQLVAADSPCCRSRFSFNHQGSLTQESWKLLELEPPCDDTTRYEYNQLGELAVIEHSGDRRQVFGRDEQGRIIEVFDSLNQSYHLAYDETGTLARIRYPSGVETHFTYSPRGNVETIQTSSGPDRPPLVAQRYRYDLRDRLVEQEINARTTEYKYDGVGRLHGVIHGEPEGAPADEQAHLGALDLALDLALDRQGNPRLLDGEEARYDSRGRLLSWGDQRFHHDARGNMIFHQAPEHWSLMRYNSAGHLVEVTTPRGRVSYQYDALGRRVLKQSRAGQTRTLWAGLMLLGEVFTDSAKKITEREFIRLPGSQLPLAIRINNQVYGLHADRLGAPLCATDKAGQVVWQASYTPWGRACISVDKIEQPLRRPGQIFDMETALHYNIFRYYDPALGRYLSPGCLGAPVPDLNPYLYGGGDPVNHLDPWLVQHFRPPGSPCSLGALVEDSAVRMKERLIRGARRMAGHANLSTIWSGLAGERRLPRADRPAPEAVESAIAALATSAAAPAVAPEAGETPADSQGAPALPQTDPLADPLLVHAIWGGRLPAQGRELFARICDHLEAPPALLDLASGPTKEPGQGPDDTDERAIALALGRDQARDFAESHRVAGDQLIADGFNDSGRHRADESPGGHEASIEGGASLPAREIILVDRLLDQRLIRHLEYAAALRATPAPARLEQLAAYVRRLLAPLPEQCEQLMAHHFRMGEIFDDLSLQDAGLVSVALTGHEVLVGEAPERLGHGASRHGALLFKILGDEAELSPALIRGKLQGRPHSWNEVPLDDGPRLLVDLSRAGSELLFPETSARNNYLYTDLSGAPLY